MPRDDQRQGAPVIDVDEKVHFVLEVRSLAILAIVFARMKTIGNGISESTYRRFVVAERKLVQRVQEIGSGQVAVQVVLFLFGFQCMPEDFRWRVPVEGKQRATVVDDDLPDRVEQAIRNLGIRIGGDKRADGLMPLRCLESGLRHCQAWYNAAAAPDGSRMTQ